MNNNINNYNIYLHRRWFYVLCYMFSTKTKTRYKRTQFHSVQMYLNV